MGLKYRNLDIAISRNLRTAASRNIEIAKNIGNSHSPRQVDISCVWVFVGNGPHFTDSEEDELTSPHRSKNLHRRRQRNTPNWMGLCKYRATFHLATREWVKHRNLETRNIDIAKPSHLEIPKSRTFTHTRKRNITMRLSLEKRATFLPTRKRMS